MQIQRHGTTRRYSDSVVHNGTVYLVEVPSNLDDDITDQTSNLLASIEKAACSSWQQQKLFIDGNDLPCRYG